MTGPSILLVFSPCFLPFGENPFSISHGPHFFFYSIFLSSLSPYPFPIVPGSLISPHSSSSFFFSQYHTPLTANSHTQPTVHFPISSLLLFSFFSSLSFLPTHTLPLTRLLSQPIFLFIFILFLYSNTPTSSPNSHCPPFPAPLHSSFSYYFHLLLLLLLLLFS